MRAGLFYFHNALDDATSRRKRYEGDLAAYWHGMVHRREGDFDNARYWMRRAGEQPGFQEMQSRASDGGAPHMARQSNWDPFLFITPLRAVQLRRKRSTKKRSATCKGGVRGDVRLCVAQVRLTGAVGAEGVIFRLPRGGTL